MTNEILRLEDVNWQEYENLTDKKAQEEWISNQRSKLPAAEWERLLRVATRQIAQMEDNPDAFFAFYKHIHGIDIPEHLKREIDHIYEAWERNIGALIFAWRGSWKTITLSVTFLSFYIGHNPHRANLILQANDSSAIDTAKMVADYIKYNTNYNDVFPYIEPDPEAGWSTEGYEIKLSEKYMQYGKWKTINAARRDPTILGLGISSKSCIGKHPDGILLTDDIHDLDNTISATERTKVVLRMTDVVLPFRVKDTKTNKWLTNFLSVGTPWEQDDAYHHLKDTGQFSFLEIPCMTPAEEGEEGAVEINKSDMPFNEATGIQFDLTDIYGWWHLTWPDVFDKETVINSRITSGQRGFWRMYMLDIARSKETGLKYLQYPSDKIDMNWLASGGVDYASTIDERGATIGTEPSKFALCVGLKTPLNTAVITTGFSGRVTQLDAEDRTLRIQREYKNFRHTAIEMNGVGAQFYALLGRHPNAKIMPFWVEKMKKTGRHEQILAPWLEMGKIMISDADLPFLNSLRKALDDWPHGSLDEIDALYAYTKTIPEVTMSTVSLSGDDGYPGGRREQEKHPLAGAFRRKKR